MITPEEARTQTYGILSGLTFIERLIVDAADDGYYSITMNINDPRMNPIVVSQLITTGYTVQTITDTLYDRYIIDWLPTPSVSISATPSKTPPVTPSLSISRTPSLSISRTPSLSISSTRTPSITPSITPSLSISRTPTSSYVPVTYGFFTGGTYSSAEAVCLDAPAPDMTLYTNAGNYPPETNDIFYTNGALTTAFNGNGQYYYVVKNAQTWGISVNVSGIATDVQLCSSITPTPTRTPSITPTITPSKSISVTPSLSISKTRTPSITPSPTPSSTPVASEFGLLYNTYAMEYNVSGETISPTGWHVPTKTEWENLFDYYSGSTLAADSLKESGYVHWNNSNTGNNVSGLGLIGGGFRAISLDDFSDIKDRGYYFTSSDYTIPTYKWAIDLEANDTDLDFFGIYKYSGISIRLVKDTTTLLHGETSTMTDYDGNLYPTICIDGVEFMAKNLKVTHFNSGTTIPEVTDYTTWLGLTSPALCAYNNDWDYAATMPTPSPTPTKTPSITPSLSVSSSVTPSLSVSSSVTPTPSETPSETPSVTPSLSISATPSKTPSVTPSETPTPSTTPSVTPSLSISATPSETPSETPSVTPSITPTPSMLPNVFINNIDGAYNITGVTISGVTVSGISFPVLPGELKTGFTTKGLTGITIIVDLSANSTGECLTIDGVANTTTGNKTYSNTNGSTNSVTITYESGPCT